MRKIVKSPDELVFNPGHKNLVVLFLSRTKEHKELSSTFSSVQLHGCVFRNAADSKRIRLGKRDKRDKKKDEQKIFHVIRLKVEQ